MLYGPSIVRRQGTMSAFVSKEKVPVTIDGKNVIYIRPKMTLGTQARLADGLKLRVGPNGGPQPGVGEGEALMLLLSETIVGWEGPDFEEDGQLLPFNHVTLQGIDPDYPLFLKVRDEVKDLYLAAAQIGTSPNSRKSVRTTKSTSAQ